MKSFWKRAENWFIIAAGLLLAGAITAAVLTGGFRLWQTSPSPDGPQRQDTPDETVYAHPSSFAGALWRGQDGLTPEKAAAQAAGAGLDILFVPAADGERLAQTAQACHANGILCYALLAADAPLGDRLDLTEESDRAALQQAAVDLIRQGGFDGLLVERTAVDPMREPPEGETLPADAWRQNCLTAAMTDLRQAVGALRPHLPVGLLAPPVWETQDAAPNGLTLDGGLPHALRDQAADTRGWLGSGLFDFAVIDNDRLLAPGEGELAFGEVIDWWAALAADKALPLAVLHRPPEGRRADELALQTLRAHEAGATGTVFDALATVTADRDEEASAALRTAKGQGPAPTGADLVLTEPGKTAFSVSDPALTLQGTADPAFSLFLNDNPLSVAADGTFTEEVALSRGDNTLTLRHKGQNLTLTATYHLQLLQKVFPDQPLTVDGGSRVSVTAIARRGSRVSAVLRGEQVELTPSPAGVSENESAFVTYAGTFTVPAADGGRQDLGAVTFTASFEGEEQTLTGAKLTVAGKAVPVPSVTGAKVTAPPGAKLGDLDFDDDLPLGPWGAVAEICSEQAETLDAQLLDERSRPTNAYLPKGTLDYCSDTESTFAKNGNVARFRTLAYGKRVYSYSDNDSGVKTDYLNIYYTRLPTENSLSVASLSRDERHTTLVLNTRWKAPFEVTMSPQNYKNPYPASGAPDYAVSGPTFTTMDIHFAYAKAAEGAIDMSEDPVFRSAAWICRDDGTYTLRLTLRQAGRFSGWGCRYNEKGQMVFTFLHPYRPQAADNAYGARLDGCVVVLDAGHGGKNAGSTGTYEGVRYYEDEMNLALTMRVADQLQKLGATVVLTRDRDVDMSLYDRAVLTRRAQPDLMISLHRNYLETKTVNGFDAFYYQPWAQPFCQAVAAQAGSLFRRNNGIHYITPMYVTRISECPAILIECGYISNTEDMSSMTQDSFDQTLAEKITQGMVDYLRGR